MKCMGNVQFVLDSSKVFRLFLRLIQRKKIVTKEEERKRSLKKVSKCLQHGKTFSKGRFH